VQDLHPVAADGFTGRLLWILAGHSGGDIGAAFR
jgi:hypothetical protein